MIKIHTGGTTREKIVRCPTHDPDNQKSHQLIRDHGLRVRRLLFRILSLPETVLRSRFLQRMRQELVLKGRERIGLSYVPLPNLLVGVPQGPGRME